MQKIQNIYYPKLLKHTSTLGFPMQMIGYQTVTQQILLGTYKIENLPLKTHVCEVQCKFKYKLAIPNDLSKV